MSKAGAWGRGGDVLLSQTLEMNQLAADNSAVTFFTVSIPNANTAAIIDVIVAGGYSDGDGCDVKRHTIAVSRVAGVASVQNISSAAAVGNNPSTGHTTMTATASITAVLTGATATNTFVIRGKTAAGSSVVSGSVHPVFMSVRVTNLLGNVWLS